MANFVKHVPAAKSTAPRALLADTAAAEAAARSLRRFFYAASVAASDFSKASRLAYASGPVSDPREKPISR